VKNLFWVNELNDFQEDELEDVKRWLKETNRPLLVLLGKVYVVYSYMCAKHDPINAIALTARRLKMTETEVIKEISKLPIWHGETNTVAFQKFKERHRKKIKSKSSAFSFGC